MSSRPKVATAASASAPAAAGSAAPGGFHACGDGLQLVLGAGRDDHVSTGFGERDRRRRADSAARAGDHRDLVSEQEPVQDHARECNTF